MVVGTLGAVGDGAFDAAGPFIVGEGERLPGPGPPGLVQGVRQQRQHPRAHDPGLAGAHVGQQDLDQVVVDAGACRLGRLGDGHPQLPLGHRRHQIAVLDRAGQLRVVGAAGLEIGAHPQHDQRRRYVIRAVPGAGGRVQRGDERPALPLIRALGEHLLELVDHQQQPRLRMRLMLAGRRAVPDASRPRWRREGGLAGGEREPGRVDVQPSPHRGRVGSRQHRHPQRQLIQRRAGRGEHQARPRCRLRRGRQSRPPDPRQHPRPQQRRLARTGNARHHQQARALQLPRHPLQQLGGGRFPAEEERRVLLLERAQPRYGESITPETLTSGGGATPSVQVSLL